MQSRRQGTGEVPFDHRWGPEEWRRYQSIDDTIVQLFRIRASGVMPYRGRRMGRLPLRDTSGD